ncbi:GNAT family N-acetyltransferase [Sporosalibacterium faouarense]|uniref:GNAT family N-acetyltransferase n=1 Tax=Sporosalibacterium faouarense TaxID=516123 RepID=UPI00141CF0C8|nr:GNAT family protein [Sporosalibacterium faouarense]MTI49938.1 GNAT family N-acetyltransferase [Bacillota bacterium]
MEYELLFSSYPVITSNEIVLKEIEVEDLNDFYEIHNSELIYKYIPGKARKNIKSVENMIGHYKRDFNKKKMIFLGIYITIPEKKLIGIAEIFDINKKINMITIGYRLNENYWGKGIATKVVKMITGYMFEKIRVNRIQAFVMAENVRSKEVLKRNEFVYEGTIRQGEIWKEKGLIDLELYSILKQDYEKL